MLAERVSASERRGNREALREARRQGEASIVLIGNLAALLFLPLALALVLR